MVVVGGEPRKVVRIGMPRKGKYMVREEIEKAPTHDHPCNLTRWEAGQEEQLIV